MMEHGILRRWHGRCYAAAIGTTIALLAMAPTALAVSSIAVSDPSVAEGNDGEEDVTFSIFVDCENEACEVSYATTGQSATAGDDYHEESGSLVFTYGTGMQRITIRGISDTAAEPDETFQLDASVATESPSPAGRGIGTIVNDDGVPADPPAPPTPIGPNTGQSPDVNPPVGTQQYTRFTARTTPQRDETKPFRFTTTGRMTLPEPMVCSTFCLNPPRDCTGIVSVAVLKGKHAISVERAFLLPDPDTHTGDWDNLHMWTGCAFEVSDSVNERGRLTVRPTFLGNIDFRPHEGPEQTVTTGRDPGRPGASCKKRSESPGRGSGDPGRSCS